MKKHFVTFYSPGTIVAEDTTLPIESWDVETAVKMAREIVERHGAKPYGFRFTTRSRTDEDLDSKVESKSKMYWLGGTISTLADVEARNDPKEKILLSNMRVNGYAQVITNKNSWAWTMPFDPSRDELLDVKLSN